MQLQRFELFEHLSVRQLADVARLARREDFPAGVEIVREGERSRSMYAITEGRVAVTRRGVAISELGPGDIFGEFAVLDGEPRSATVTTRDPVRVLRIEGRDLVALMNALPGIAIAITRKLSQLVRGATERAFFAGAPS